MKLNTKILPMDESESNVVSISGLMTDAKKSDNKPSKLSFTKAVSSWLKLATRQKHDISLKETLEEIIEEHNGASDDKLEPEERVMLHNILSFGETKVSDIMVPRTDICSVPIDIGLAEIKSHILEYKHTRIPVYEQTIDKILGFIHVKDMLPVLGGEAGYDIKKMIRDVLFVPPSMRIIDLLVKMRKAGSHMAIVVDEYGGTDGLVTMENLFEEIVGDIQDEHDEDEEQEDRVIHISANIHEVSARIRIEKLEKEFGVKLINEGIEDEFETLGGLIFFQLGRVPVKGETIHHESGLQFNILEADPRRVNKVQIITATKD